MNQEEKNTQSTDNMERIAFLFYEKYYKVLFSVNDKQMRELLKAICEFALYGKEKKKLSDKVANGFWQCVRPTLERGRINARNRLKKEEKKEENNNVYAPLAEYGVCVDCGTEGFDEAMLQSEFAKSAFLRKTFKTTSKIKHFYEKIKQGNYQDVKHIEQKVAEEQGHRYTDEELRGALVDFSEWQE